MIIGIDEGYCLTKYKSLDALMRFFDRCDFVCNDTGRELTRSYVSDALKNGGSLCVVERTQSWDGEWQYKYTRV